MAKRKNNLKDKIEEDIIEVTEDKEEEILNYFDDDYEIVDEDDDYDDFEEEKEYVEEPKMIQDNIYETYDDDGDYEEYDYDDDVEKKSKFMKVFNIVFTIITICVVMIIIDVVAVSKYNKGPYFAIRTHRYNDGGTKEYCGLGYKVIDYNQVQGRRDKELGKWSLKYNVEPVTIQDVDLAIEVRNNEKETYEKYYKKFVRIISTLKAVDSDKRTITLGFDDEEGEYSMDIVCSMVEDQDNLEDLKIGDEITIIGTLTDLSEKTTTKPIRVYVSNVFAEQ